MSRMTDVKEIVFVCIEGRLLAFHVSVITLIVTQISKRNVKFCSAFFVINTLLSLANIGNSLPVFFTCDGCDEPIHSDNDADDSQQGRSCDAGRTLGCCSWMLVTC